MDVGVDIGSRKIKVTMMSGVNIFEPSEARLIAATLIACADAIENDRARRIDDNGGMLLEED